MPHVTISKVWVLVDHGQVQRLRTNRQFREACEKFNADPENYQLELRDLLELTA